MPARCLKQVGTGSTKDGERSVIVKNMYVFKTLELSILHNEHFFFLRRVSGVLDADWSPYKYKVLLQCAVSPTFVRFTRVSAPAVSEFVVLSSPS